MFDQVFIQDLASNIASIIKDQISDKGQEKFLTPTETAERLGLDVNTLKRWRANKKVALPYVKFGHFVRYRWADIEEFAKNQTH